jgi:hypothetical protein
MGKEKCIFACSLKPYDMQKVKNALIKPVQFVVESIICVLVVCMYVSMVKIRRIHHTQLIDDFQLQNGRYHSYWIYFFYHLCGTPCIATFQLHNTRSYCNCFLIVSFIFFPLFSPSTILHASGHDVNLSYPPVVFVTHLLTPFFAEFVSCSALLYALWLLLLLLLRSHLPHFLSYKLCKFSVSY